MRFFRALAGLTAMLALSGTPAAAQGARALSGAELATVMTAYVETVAELRDLYAACASTQLEGWDAGAALLVESLRAARVDDAAVEALAARLAAPAAGGVGCGSEEAQLRSPLPPGTDWPAYHSGVLRDVGIEVVVPAETDTRLAAARAAVDRVLTPQARMLQCLSLFDPRGFVIAYREWSVLVGHARDAFAAAGYTADVYEPILAEARSDALFSPPADRRAALAGCVADQDWFDRYATFAFYTLPREVEEALKDGAP